MPRAAPRSRARRSSWRAPPGDALGEAQGLYCLGRNLHSQADYPGVFETQGDSLALFRSLGHADGEARCCNLLGITHRQLADYGRALEMYDAALKGFRETGDLKWQARVISNIGNVEIQLGNHSAALELFEQALDIRREIGDTEGAGFDLNNAAFGRVQRALQLRGAGDRDSCQIEAESALKLLDRALAIARQYGYKRLEAYCLQTMGEAYQAMARPEVALGMADDFLRLAHESSDKWIEAYGLACAGELRHQLGRHAEALEQLGKALAWFESLGARDQAARVLRILSQAHEALDADHRGARVHPQGGCHRPGAAQRGDREPRPRAGRAPPAGPGAGRDRALPAPGDGGFAHRARQPPPARRAAGGAGARGAQVGDGGHRGARRRGPLQGHQRPLLPRGGRRGAALRGRGAARPLPPRRPRRPLRRRGIHDGLPPPRDPRRRPRSASACAARSRAGTGSPSTRSCG